jgi:hypothetical protein
MNDRTFNRYSVWVLGWCPITLEIARGAYATITMTMGLEMVKGGSR